MPELVIFVLVALVAMYVPEAKEVICDETPENQQSELHQNGESREIPQPLDPGPWRDSVLTKAP